jgi:hypothetical protein
MEHIPENINPDDLKHLETTKALVVQSTHYNYAFLDYLQSLALNDKEVAHDLIKRATPKRFD